MDPMTVLITALGAGATLLKPVADRAVMDAYAELKEFIVRRYRRRDRGLDGVLADFTADPSAQAGRARQALARVGADRDQEVLDRATELVRLAEEIRPGISGGLIGRIDARGGRVHVTHADRGGIATGPGHRGPIYVSQYAKPADRTFRRAPWWAKAGLVLGLAVAIVGFGMAGFGILTWIAALPDLRPGSRPAFPPPGVVPGFGLFFAGLVLLVVAGVGTALAGHSDE